MTPRNDNNKPLPVRTRMNSKRSDELCWVSIKKYYRTGTTSSSPNRAPLRHRPAELTCPMPAHPYPSMDSAFQAAYSADTRQLTVHNQGNSTRLGIKGFGVLLHEAYQRNTRFRRLLLCAKRQSRCASAAAN